MVTLDPYRPVDLQDVLNLFYETVHHVNKKDYSPEQLHAWVPSATLEAKNWNNRLVKCNTWVAWIQNEIVGFGNLNSKGTEIGMLYVHKNFQGRAIGDLILKRLEELLVQKGLTEAWVEASITARPFFEKHGYQFIRDNRKVRNGVELFNFIMKKELYSKQTR